jgi:hypothetical protein
MRKEEKPLPAIKPEPSTQPRSRKMSPQDIRTVQSDLQEQNIASKNEKKPPVKEKSGRKRPNLTINIGREPPPPPAKDAKDKPSSEFSLSTTAPASKLTAEPVSITASPGEIPSDPKPIPLPAEPIRIPLVAEPEPLDTNDANESIPTIEVSTARSVSVKRGKRHILVPIGSRVDHFNANERFVDRKALTPRITDVGLHLRHKHAVSQELQIESV